MSINPFALAGALIATSLNLVAVAPAPAASVRVPYADLDLASDAGAATMDARLRQAAAKACAPADLRELATRMSCVNEALLDGRAQLRLARGGASEGVRALR